MSVSWTVTPCGLVHRYYCFGGTYYLHLQGRSNYLVTVCELNKFNELKLKE